jgi:hypothetical protein
VAAAVGVIQRAERWPARRVCICSVTSGRVPIHAVLCSSPIVRFLTDTRLKQTSPPETAFQPLSHYGVVLNVSPQLLAGKPVPATLKRMVPLGECQLRTSTFPSSTRYSCVAEPSSASRRRRTCSCAMVPIPRFPARPIVMAFLWSWRNRGNSLDSLG